MPGRTCANCSSSTGWRDGSMLRSRSVRTGSATKARYCSAGIAASRAEGTAQPTMAEMSTAAAPTHMQRTGNRRFFIDGSREDTDAIISSSASGLLHALHDPEIPVGRPLAEHAQRFLIARAVMTGDRVRHAGEFDHDGSQQHAALVRMRRDAAREELAARGLDRRAGELRIRRDLLGMVDRAVERNPVALCHEVSYEEDSHASTIRLKSCGRWLITQCPVSSACTRLPGRAASASAH